MSMKPMTVEQVREGHRKDPTFINQEVERFGECGIAESNSDESWFSVTLERIGAAHPNVLFVDKTGPYSIRQIIFLPRRKREVVSMLRRELKQYEEAAMNTRAALAKLEVSL